MSDPRWQRLWEVFHRAVELPPREHSAFLANELPDDADLRAEVEELLEAAAGAGPLDGELAPDFDGEPEESTESAPDSTIGPYRLGAVLGRGGMGVVYEAFQQEPVTRRVALKIVPWGMDTREVLTRFQSERQALALMNHPHIARIFDCGSTPRGRPYFVMELVSGRRLTDYADDHRLGLEARIQLFLLICRAVEHAHRKGILHRDLKPSNLLVTEIDGRPEPKVIDFGLARAIDPGLTADARTRWGGVLGTPEYMSPEQARGDPDVDTRTDVYSLGVVLYELLTGRLPTAARDASGVDRPTPRPSDVVRQGADSGEVAARRDSEPDRLRRALRGEVDWIVLRALDRDPARRYGSAMELAADLERSLRHEPVVAAPPKLTYRAGRFVRRHRLGVGVAAAGLLLLAGFAAHTRFRAAELARALEQSRRVQDFLIAIFQSSDPAAARGREVSAREILDRGAERVEKELASDPRVQSELMNTMGAVYRQMGYYDRSEALLAAAIERRRQAAVADSSAEIELAASLRQLGRTQNAKGDATGAERTLLEAAGLSRRSARARDAGGAADLAATLLDLATARQSRADLAGAEDAVEEALALQQQFDVDAVTRVRSSAVLAQVRHRMGALEEAEVAYREALQVLERAEGSDHPELASLSSGLGALRYERGDLDEAEALYRRGLALQRRVLPEGHTRIATTLNNLALVLVDRRQFAEAEAMQLEALAINRRALGDEHVRVAGNLNNLGTLWLEQGVFDRAESYLVQSQAMHERLLGADNPAVAFALNNRARVEQERGRPKDSEALYRRALEIRRRRLPPDHPDLAASLFGLGALLVEGGRAEESEPLLREAMAIRRAKFGTDDWRTAEAEATLGRCFERRGRLAEAEALLETALATLSQRRGDQDPKTQRAAAWLAELRASAGRSTGSSRDVATPAPRSTGG